MLTNHQPSSQIGFVLGELKAAKWLKYLSQFIKSSVSASVHCTDIYIFVHWRPGCTIGS
jgi:hypothetical protein